MVFLCFGGYTGFDCSMIWIIMILLFFIAAIFRRQVADGLMDTPFNIILATAVAELSFISSLNFLSIRWSFIIGLIGMMVGGFVGAMFWEEE